MKAPDFSGFAEQYARSRPRYPPELLGQLASFLDRRKLAWDCATGSGQAAIGLVEHFDRVVASDVSAAQVRHAVRHPRIAYMAARAEHAPLSDASADWDLDRMLAFITSWSGTQKYMEAHGENPVEAIIEELEGIWGDRERVLTVRWPLYLLASRL